MKKISFLAGALLFFSDAQAQQGTLKSELHGRVTSITEIALVGAEVTVLRDSLSAITDASGRFILREIPPGEHIIRVRRIGFQPLYLAATLRSGERRQVAIVLAPGAYHLPDVEVSELPSKPIEYAYTSKYDEFFRRQRVGLGRYITRQDINRKTSTETADLLMGVPGIIVIPGAPGIRSTSVRVPGCQKVSVWLDGVELQTYGSSRNRGASIGNSTNQDQVTGELLEHILPSQIEMIEIYSGPARMPAETIGNSCAAIMIWTR